MVEHRQPDDNVLVRYRRAIEKLHFLAEKCQWTTNLPTDEPFVQEAYVFGEVLDGNDPIEKLEVAFALNLPPEEVPWCSNPPGTPWLVDNLRLDRGGIEYRWRSRHEPVGNDHIRDPVRFWSLAGTDEAVLNALAQRRFADLPRQRANQEEVRRRTAADLERAWAQLRAVHEKYWDEGWRREHRGTGRYPEEDLWDATRGYLELRDSSRRESS